MAGGLKNDLCASDLLVICSTLILMLFAAAACYLFNRPLGAFIKSDECIEV